MRRPAWQSLRLAQIARAGSRCEHCTALTPRLDVIANGRAWLVLCRACRVSSQAPAVQAKRAATLRARRAQLRLPHVERGRAA